METKKYLSNEWKFVEPLSIRTSAQLRQLRASCFALEDFLAELAVTLKKFTFHGTDYNSYLSLELDFTDYPVLESARWDFYGFLIKKLPVNYREVDWMNDFHIHQSLSSIFQSKDDQKTYISLVLNYRQYQVEFPSHDFICMSEDLNRTDDLRKAA
jgi:hypothetical protein